MRSTQDEVMSVSTLVQLDPVAVPTLFSQVTQISDSSTDLLCSSVWVGLTFVCREKKKTDLLYRLFRLISVLLYSVRSVSDQLVTMGMCTPQSTGALLDSCSLGSGAGGSEHPLHQGASLAQEHASRHIRQTDARRSCAARRLANAGSPR